MPRFRAEVERRGKTATGFEVPAEVVEDLGAGKRPPVRVTLGTHTYRSTIAPYGGHFFLPLSRANREAAGVVAGETPEVRVELDEEPRTVDVPADLERALAAKPEAGALFAKLSYTHRREYVDWISGAKRAETRERRIRGTVERLLTGRTSPR